MPQLVDSDVIDEVDRIFPDGFLFGTSTAAYQIEGAWNTSGKGPSIWDQFTHEHPDRIADRKNCDVGPDSYHFYEEDIKAVKSLGVCKLVLRNHCYQYEVSLTKANICVN